MLPGVRCKRRQDVSVCASGFARVPWTEDAPRRARRVVCMSARNLNASDVDPISSSRVSTESKTTVRGFVDSGHTQHSPCYNHSRVRSYTPFIALFTSPDLFCQSISTSE